MCAGCDMKPNLLVPRFKCVMGHRLWFDLLGVFFADFTVKLIDPKVLVFSKYFRAGFYTFSSPKKRLKLAEN